MYSVAVIDLIIINLFIIIKSMVAVDILIELVLEDNFEGPYTLHKAL